MQKKSLALTTLNGFCWTIGAIPLRYCAIALRNSEMFCLSSVASASTVEFVSTSIEYARCRSLDNSPRISSHEGLAAMPCNCASCCCISGGTQYGEKEIFAKDATDLAKKIEMIIPMLDEEFGSETEFEAAFKKMA